MRKRLQTLQSSRPLSLLAQHHIHDLSDINEASNSSKGNLSQAQKNSNLDVVHESSDSSIRADHHKSDAIQLENEPQNSKIDTTTPLVCGLGSRAPSSLSLPVKDIPERRSSASMFVHSAANSRQCSVQEFLPHQDRNSRVELKDLVRNPGQAESPIKHEMHRSALSSETLRKSPSKTLIRTTPPLEILEQGSSQHPRIDMSVHLPCSLFVGGGTVEGQITLTVDGNTARKVHMKPMYLSKLSVDVIGVEEINDGRRWVFLSLATELLSSQHPPPASLVMSQEPLAGHDLRWQLKPSSSTIPFCINLPLKLGPPPYLSKQACIRYILCPSATVRIGNKSIVVRQVWNIQMLTVHDPERALGNLPSPLLSTETATISQSPEVQTVRLTAGLHRQTWVNGNTIFVDVNIVNATSRTIKKIDLEIQKTTLWYSRAAAGTAERSASHLRLAKRNDSEIVARSSIKQSVGWQGVAARSSEIRTCEILVPRGHVTIGTGRYFEIRYYLNISVPVTYFKTVTVQLPVTLIHMNSLDIVPNSLSQVAASIEAKRAGQASKSSRSRITPQAYQPGQAFSAPRRQSTERSLARGSDLGSEEVKLLATDLDHSPRRYRSQLKQPIPSSTYATLASNNNGSAPDPPPHMQLSVSQNIPSNQSCTERPSNVSNVDGPALTSGPRLPRLQVSTSGLGFSESEFELPADSPPRKVMLSESERKMIDQQIELRLQREWTRMQRSNSKTGHDYAYPRYVAGPNRYVGWRHIAVAQDGHLQGGSQLMESASNKEVLREPTPETRPKPITISQLKRRKSDRYFSNTSSNMRNSRYEFRGKATVQTKRRSFAEEDASGAISAPRSSYDRRIRTSTDRLY